MKIYTDIRLLDQTSLNKEWKIFIAYTPLPRAGCFAFFSKTLARLLASSWRRQALWSPKADSVALEY